MTEKDSSKELWTFLKGDSVEYIFSNPPQSWSQSDIDEFCAALKSKQFGQRPSWKDGW